MTALEVTRVVGLATVQDMGRPGRMHEGIPPGGALAPELLARANEAVRNPANAAGVEVIGSLAFTARDGGVIVATEDGVARALAEGESWRVEPSRSLRARYVAVRGGIDVPVVLGGRGTLLVAGFGGVEGRGLRRGDVVAVGSASECASAGRRASIIRSGDEDPVRVRVGPDLQRFAPDALHTLLTGAFLLSPSSDRTGSRLSGPRLARLDDDDGVSAPMVAGAIEVPASGDPIVLGPDHPTTGGYPVLAVILRADLCRFHARPIGSLIRFV